MHKWLRAANKNPEAALRLYCKSYLPLMVSANGEDIYASAPIARLNQLQLMLHSNW